MIAVIGCPKDKKGLDTVAVAPLDTIPQDLSSLQPTLPPADPDTFKAAQPAPPTPAGPTYPSAPDPLIQAVSREAGATEFCYNEFGLKADPKLRGSVTMLVTVGSRGVTAAKVGNSLWAPRSGGAAVNTCLNQRAKDAIKLAAGEVKPGIYMVPLSFTPR
jgi:hypothetical protein